METLLTNRTASLTEFRDPGKLIREAGDKPVAILNRNRLVGYFVPASAVNRTSFELVDPDEFAAVLSESIEKNKAILEYLKDK